MPRKYPRRVVLALSEDDYAQLKRSAERDRRSIGQYTSMLVEDVLSLERKGTTPQQIVNQEDIKQ